MARGMLAEKIGQTGETLGSEPINFKDVEWRLRAQIDVI